MLERKKYQTILAAECLRRVKELEHDISHLASMPDIQRVWGLTDEGITVTFGGDVECELYDPIAKRRLTTRDVENNALSQASEYQYNLNRRTRSEQSLKESRFDKSQFEFHPKQDTPLEYLKRFHFFSKEGKLLANNMGLNFRVGTGHWHLSLHNGNKPIIASADGSYSQFTDSLAAQILYGQVYAPALFIEPYRREHPDESKLTTLFLGCSKSKKTSIRLGEQDKYENGSRPFEIRIANLCPEFTSMAILHAIKDTLKQSEPLPISFSELDYKYDSNENIRNLKVTGKGQNITQDIEDGLKDIKNIKISSYITEKFPELRTLFTLACIEGYEEYLYNPRNKRYAPSQHQQIKYELQTLKQETVTLFEAEQEEQPTPFGAVG